MRYDFYGIGSDAGGLGIKVPLTQEASVGIVEAMRETLPNLYLGLRYLCSHTSVGLEGSNLPLPPGVVPEQIRLSLALAMLSMRVQYDTRNSDFYPTQGVLVDGEAQFSDKAFGSDRSYQSYVLSGNVFLSLSDHQVLAFRAVGKTAQGRAPFFVFPAFGSKNDLRGYVAGRYRDRWLVAGQVEYRLCFGERFGLVAFAGLGSVASEIDEFDLALPSIRGGVRYVLAKQNNVSFRFDVAWGKDDVAFYFGVGEPF